MNPSEHSRARPGAILVNGGGGQLGTELARASLPAGWKAVVLDRDGLDLNDAAAIAAMLAGRDWQAVINAAAFARVDDAEREVVAAWQVNALAPTAFSEAVQGRAFLSSTCRRTMSSQVIAQGRGKLTIRWRR